jgi:hypothetical protein
VWATVINGEDEMGELSWPAECAIADDCEMARWTPS